MREKFYNSCSASDTEVIGANLALSLIHTGRRRVFVAMFGEMGVGKTAFSRGFCSALGIKNVHSPTYAIVNEYKGGKVPVFHFDMYRIESEDDLCSIGFDDYLARDGFALCEWSERIENELPEGTVRVFITRTDDADGRQIKIVTAD